MMIGKLLVLLVTTCQGVQVASMRGGWLTSLTPCRFGTKLHARQ